MPQVNRAFQLSKMNKDFDERIVKDGEYRDALNVQVQASEDSDVGTVQSILGNVLMSSGMVPDGSRCVGAVTYDKEDKIYYLVAGPEYTIDNIFDPGSWKDYIIEYDVATKTFKYVFVDIYRTHFLTSVDNTTNPQPQYLELNDPLNPPISNARFEMHVNGYNPAGTQVIFSDDNETTTITDVGEILVNSNIFPKILINSIERDFNDSAANPIPSGSIIHCTQKRALNFRKNNLITGINIIDGMLFWTDNISEPKKINIERSISGTGGATELPISITTLFTGDNADWHTRICITPDQHNGLRVLRRTASKTYYAEEENITVIKKGPRTPPILEMSRHKDGRLGDTFSPSATGILGNPDTLPQYQSPPGAPIENCFTKLEVTVTDTFRVPKVAGDTIGDFYVDNPVDWQLGDIILFNQQQDINSAEGFTDHDVRAIVKAPLPCGGVMPCTGPWHMEIQSIDGDDIDEEQKMWNLRLEEPKPMFEFKFVRFAYRYKYEDGEYSTFSPWSELAFLPGEYDYLPMKGYNLGMTNRLRQLFITNYIVEPSERPKDVIEVDLLYKDESSPNIYTVETIKRTDGWTVKGELLWPDTLNGPNVLATGSSRGRYEVTSELIHKTVPSNQMLRPWDNIPRKALAQSISANRLVYGNYVQNFDLTSSLSCGDEFDVEIKPEINVSLRAVDAPLNAPPGTSNDPLNQADDVTGFAYPGRTARSLRTYQVGVVYGDEYGRETPVLAGHNGTGSLTIAKENSSTLNKLHVAISTPAPDFAHYYKLYVKETSNEYYNLAMDRWYNAEDGNIWLSFASADRNKVDEETTLILKKKHDSHFPVTDKARYKILAIENEAPDFIKTNIKNLGSLTNNAGGSDIGTTANGFPAPDADKLWFTTGITGLSDIFNSAADAQVQLTGMRNRGTLYFRVRTDTIKSDWYQVAGYTMGSGRHKFKSDKPFGDDMAFTSVGGDISTVISGLKIELAEHTVENKKEFEGRFFVKIFKDLVLKNEILTTIQPEYRVRTAMPIGYWNIPKMETPNAISANVQTWESAGVNMKREFDSNTNVADDWCADALNNPDDRELWFYGANGQSIVGEGTTLLGCANGTGAVQGNVRDWMTSSIGVFHIDNMYVRGHRDFNCCTGLFCTCCNNLSSDGGTIMMGRGIHDGAGNPDMDGMFMDIGYITSEEQNNTPYNWGNPDAENFYDLLRTPGTKFRWREDPDELVYVVKSSIPCSASGNSRHGQMHTWHDQTSGKSGNNKYRFQIEFESVDSPGTGFGGGLSTYHPIGGKDTTKVAGREELGYWGGVQSTMNTVYAGNNGKFNNSGIPLPPGYDLVAYPNGAPANDSGGQIYNSIEDYVGNDSNASLLSVTKEEMGCRWRRHASKFHHIEILEPLEDDDADWSSENPAIWETEPKEDVGVDIYYEASPALPIRVDYKTNEMFAPFDSKVVNMFGKHVGTDPTATTFPADNYVVAWSGNSVQFTYPIDVGTTTGARIGFERADGLVTYAIVNQSVDPSLPVSDTNFQAPSNYFTIRYINECPHPTDNIYSDGPHNQPVDLGWYNAYAWGNGIESDRIRDDFNQVTIANGVKASSVIATQYKEERRQTGLIHSGIYNSTSGVNNLNQFIAAEKITKDMNPEYGSIQKLHTREGDIVVMHEDKIMKVLADKNALYNADGSANVALAEKFLGSDRPFATKYGISTNPESFATDLHGRIYFADRARSAVLRLSGDGITNISNYGMKDWFNDHLNPHTGVAIGSYDAKKNLYNLSIEGYIAPRVEDKSTIEDDIYQPVDVGGCACSDPNFEDSGDSGDNPDSVSDIVVPDLPGYTFFQKTLSYSEQAKGWVSFKSFFPEWGLSINNEYYTWKDAHMYQHHANNTRNYFYGTQYKSTINVLFNDLPETVKSFTTLNYEGSQARISKFTTVSGYDDGEYFNLQPKDGWYVESSTTNLQSSGELEFKNKEDKYFSYMKGVATTLQNLDEQEFSVQGVGVLGVVPWGDPGDPSVPPVVEDPLDYCLNITPSINCSAILGCTDPTADNFDATANTDDGSCTYSILGCTDASAWNYNPLATTDDGSCCYIRGCMDDTAGSNPDVNGNDSNGNPCTYPCVDGYAADNFDPSACFDFDCQYTGPPPPPCLSVLDFNDINIIPPSSYGACDGGFSFNFVNPCFAAGCADWSADENYAGYIIDQSTGVQINPNAPLSIAYVGNIVHVTVGGTFGMPFVGILCEGTYEIVLESPSSGCASSPWVIGIPEGASPLLCAPTIPAFPIPSYKVSDEGLDDYQTKMDAKLAAYLNAFGEGGMYMGWNHNYPPVSGAPIAFGTTSAVVNVMNGHNVDHFANGNIVQDLNGDYECPVDYGIKINTYTRIPYELAVALDSQWADINGVTGNLLSSGTQQAIPCGNDPVTDPNGGDLLTTADYVTDTHQFVATSAWNSQRFTKWSEFQDKLTTLTDQNGNPLFKDSNGVAINFSSSIYNMFWVKWFLAHWSGTECNQVQSIVTQNSIKCVCQSTGCTDPTALNYNSCATTDDGSCDYGL